MGAQKPGPEMLGQRPGHGGEGQAGGVAGAHRVTVDVRRGAGQHRLLDAQCLPRL